MLEEYVYYGGKKLRCGYTTGSCSAAAAKAAAMMLLSGERVETVELMTPKGICLRLNVLETELEPWGFQGNADTPEERLPEAVKCAVRKDSGDDPDITDGILIYARVRKIPEGVEIVGGQGIGTVTRPGLNQPVGAAAINSTPRKMIAEALREVAQIWSYDGGFWVEISAPEGVFLAEKTFNPRLGIEGGISIIGTSGIVEPMSSRAVVDTIALEMRQYREANATELLLTLGNYSNTFLTEYMPKRLLNAVKCSNYIGEALDLAMEYGFKRVLIVGHIGKLVKLGAGIMNTHSSQADGRMEVLVACGVLAGVDTELLKQVLECVTVDEALALFDSHGVLQPVLEVLSERIQYYLDLRVKKTLEVGAVLFSLRYGILCRTGALADWKLRDD